MKNEKQELAALSNDGLRAYNRICAMGLRCMASPETKAINIRHLQATSELLEERGISFIRANGLVLEDHKVDGISAWDRKEIVNN